MARVRFSSDFDFKPTKRVTVAYIAGMEVTVKRACADQAIAAGKAEEMLPRRSTVTQQIGNPDEDEGKIPQP
ncbi:hypothetical protein PMI09_00669 [Rhizobium sp. CF122]|nr:hypothetical protein PMI09_00669 [Rhizobium sp. CF122]